MLSLYFKFVLCSVVRLKHCKITTVRFGVTVLSTDRVTGQGTYLEKTL
jgi:hypothetical protein